MSYFKKKFYMPPVHDREARFAGLWAITACVFGFCNGACGLVLREYGDREGNGLWSGFSLVFVGLLGLLTWWTKCRQFMVLYLVLSLFSLFLQIIQVAMAAVQLVFWRHFEEASSHCYIYMSHCRCTTYDAKKLPIPLTSCKLIYKFDEMYSAVIAMSVLGGISCGVMSFIGCLSTCFDGTTVEKDDIKAVDSCPLELSDFPTNEDISTRNERQLTSTSLSPVPDNIRVYWSPQTQPRLQPHQLNQLAVPPYWTPQLRHGTRQNYTKANSQHHKRVYSKDGKRARGLANSNTLNIEDISFSSNMERRSKSTQNSSFCNKPPSKDTGKVNPANNSSPLEHNDRKSESDSFDDPYNKDINPHQPTTYDSELEVNKQEPRDEDGSNNSQSGCSLLGSRQQISPHSYKEEDSSHLPTYDELFRGAESEEPAKEEKSDAKPSHGNESESQTPVHLGQ